MSDNDLSPVEAQTLRTFFASTDHGRLSPESQTEAAELVRLIHEQQQSRPAGSA